MSHLVPPQEEKRAQTPSTLWQGNLPVDHEIPPQYEPSSTKVEDPSYLIPPQEEKRQGSTGGKPLLDKGVERLETQLDRHAVRDDTQSRDEQIQNRQIRNSVLAGAAGVTGEDLGVAENERVV